MTMHTMTSTPPPTIKRSGARAVCTLTFDAAQKHAAEEKALERLGARLEIPGFRIGKAPLQKVRERVKENDLFEETVRLLIGPAVTALVEREKLLPIIPPRVAVTAREPLTIQIILIERPAVQIKGLDNMQIEKKKGEPGEEQRERMRREQALLDAIKDHTIVDLPAELIEEEARGIFEELAGALQRAGFTLDDWLKHHKKSPEELDADLRSQAQARLTVRLGLAAAIEEKNIIVSEEELRRAAERIGAEAPADQQAQMQSTFSPGSAALGELRWRMQVEKVVTALLAQ